MEKKSAWEILSEKGRLKEVDKLADNYIRFLNSAKTEIESVRWIRRVAEESGFKSVEELKEINSKDKLFATARERNIALIRIGRKPLREGFRIVASHIDAPRIDLKQVPLFQDSELALLETHYYGGIKKYQWVAIPLSLHIHLVKEDGKVLDLVLGENEKEPAFTIADLLPHLAQKQMEKKVKEAVTGEALDILAGSMPELSTKEEKNKEKEQVKKNILKILKEEYDITEEDFVSADIEVTPAFKAQYVGFDKSLVGGYGQDDRICAFTSLQAILEHTDTEYTTIALFVDKEEIGSTGITGMKSPFLKGVVRRLLRLMDEATDVEEVLESSKGISADVTGGINPTYKDVYEIRNTPKIGYGISITKFTGSRGKAGGSEATAEYMALIRRIFNQNDVPWQTGELGKVDEGGGGTIAQYMTNLGIEVVDAGPPLLGMHSPFEVSSKVDLYSSYLGYKVFYESA